MTSKELNLDEWDRAIEFWDETDWRTDKTLVVAYQKMTSKEAICWNCHGFFKYDTNDTTPNIWHKCPSGMLTATKNPNLKEKEYRRETEKLSPHEIELQNKKALNKMLKAVYG